MSDVFRIPYTELCEKISTQLVAHGIPRDRADIEAQLLVDADLSEVSSHGVRMLPGLLAALKEGRVIAAPEIEIERELAAICVVNCGNGPGRYASVMAMQLAMERANKFGVGVCLAKHTTHWGRAHAYANLAAQAGLVGICTSNAIPSMAVWGAKTRVLGNNPLAIGIPHKNKTEPVVLDIAMSQAAVGKVGTWLREGKALPSNWGIDAAGNITSDPQAILSGAVLPMGEHKGAGLAVMLELLTAALAGAAFGYQLLQKDKSAIDPDATKIFIALNVKAFIDPDEFTHKVNEFLNYLSHVAAPFQYPGERGWQARKANLALGVPLHKDIVEQLKKAGLSL